MPKAVSKRQWRFMQAILHGKPKAHPRGTPPKSIAGKYTSPGTDAPEQSGSNTGGTWGEKAHTKAKKKVEEARIERKKKKAAMKKSFEEFYKGRGAGCIVVNKKGQVLLGKQKNGVWSAPGGHAESDEDFDECALRELREEAGLVGQNPVKIAEGKFEGNNSEAFLVTSYKGKLSTRNDPDNEFKDLQFFDIVDIPWEKVRGCSKEALKQYISKKLQKSNKLQDILVQEDLEKNIARTTVPAGNNGFIVSHGDALTLVGNGAFRMLREATSGMTDEDWRKLKVDNYILTIRKHVNDIYSGTIEDGNKTIHQFTNKTLPEMTADIMSVFEWYLPEDAKELELLDDLSDDVIEGGISELIDNYKRHNIGEIYEEMENIREEIRHGAAVDLQQVEIKMVKLFDRLEMFVNEIASKHNGLADAAGDELDMLEQKLQNLQDKIDSLSQKPISVEAIATNPRRPDSLLSQDYCYLSRPQIEISPNGKIKITFSSDWNILDQENFLHDMRAKIIKKTRHTDD